MRAREFTTPPEGHQILDEVNMAPHNLQRMAAKIDATVGMEFEMILSGIGSMDDDGEMVENYDDNPRARTIEAICDFYYDDDYNDHRTIRELRERMEDQYREWFDEWTNDEWGKVSEDRIREYVTNNQIDVDDAVEQYMEDELGLDQQQIKVAMRAGAQARDITSSKQLKLFADENEAFEHYRAARAAIDEQVDQLVKDALENLDDNWSAAYDIFADELRDEQMVDKQEEWLFGKGIENMRDVTDYYSEVTWPHWDSTDGEVDIGRIADRFGREIGRPVTWSKKYHGAKRGSTNYCIEPDGSLDADDSDDSGLEFISPPLPLEEMISDLQKVKQWADYNDAYTNDSTGLHCNVSVPNFSRDNLDYVKLALLLGDKHVLEQFGRIGNTYCKSAIDTIVNAARNNEETIAKVFDLLKNKLNGVASKMLHSGATNKYTSINTKDSYIEFRSPGDDWLSDEKFNQIESTIYRFVVALDAACDIDKYRSEYLKKLYKMLSGGDDAYGPAIAEFSKYMTALQGTAPESGDKLSPETIGILRDARQAMYVMLRRQGKQTNRGRPGYDGKKYWWKVSIRNGSMSVEVVATSEKEAKLMGLDTVRDWRINGYQPSNMTAKVIKPYDEVGRSHPSAQQYRPHSEVEVGDDEPSTRDYIVRPVHGGHTVILPAHDDAQARRIARLMYPNSFPESLPDDEIRVIPA